MTDTELRKKLKANLKLASFVSGSFERGEGCYFYECGGRKILDLSSGYGVVNIGWQHPEMVAFQKQQVEVCNYAPPWLPTKQSLELSEKLISLFPNASYKCIRTTGGANGNEVLLSVFSFLTGGGIIGTFKQSYHGWSQATLGMSEENTFELPAVKSTYRSIKVDAFADPRTIFDSYPDIRVFVAEPILGSGGVVCPSLEYWKDFYKICKERGVYLIFDEAITGFGRTGKMFACDYFGIEPDGIVLAKSITSGYCALGACLVKTEYLEKCRWGDVSATFSWMPYACAVTLKNIEIIEKYNLASKANFTGQLLKERLNNIFSRARRRIEVRGVGMMIGFTVYDDRGLPDKLALGRFLLNLYKNGIMVTISGDDCSGIVLPPLIFGNKEVEETCEIFEKTVVAL